MDKNDPLDLGNPLLRLGHLVSFGAMPYQQALVKAKEDPDIQALPDERLLAHLKETDAYWRQGLPGDNLPPTSRIIFPDLMVAITEARVKAVAQVAQAASDREAANLRKAEWLTQLARCKLAQGMALLLLPQPKVAYQTFVEANWLGRAMPDFGKLRLAEVMAAAYGMRTAAEMGGPPDLSRQADAEFQALSAYRGREAEAQSYREQIEKDFSRILENLRHRQQGGPEPSTQQQLEEMKSDPAQYYRVQLTALAHVVHQGGKTFDEALRTLLELVDPKQLTAQHLYFIAVMHRGLKNSNPRLAATLLELNYQVAQHVKDPKIAQARAELAGECGAAWAKYAFQNKHDKEAYQKALPYLRLALAGVSRETDYDRGRRAHLNTLLGTCLRGLEDFAGARDAFQLAIAALRSAQDANEQQILGSAIGNLADVQEHLQESDDALDNHLEAFRLFLRTRDFPNARRALDFISRLALRLGRIDHALEAYREAAAAALAAADLDLAVECLLGVGRWGWMIRDLDESFAALHHAHRLLQSAHDKDRPERQRQQGSTLLLLASYYIVGVQTKYLPEASLARGREVLQEVRALAQKLQDQDLSANALLQLTVLHIQAHQYEEASHYYQEALAIELPRHFAGRRDEIGGRLRSAQGQYAEAQRLFESALANYNLPDVEMRRFSVYEGLGLCHEAANAPGKAVEAYEWALNYYEERRGLLAESTRLDFAGNAQTIQQRLIRLYVDPASATLDSWQALYWIDKSKSRTLVDMVRHSYLAVGQYGEELRPLLEEEQSRLAELHQIRIRLGDEELEGPTRLTLNQEFQETEKKLRVLWERLAVAAPEYVNMRRGSELTWQDVQALIA